jgi:polyisoprenoid-binding protein YceI
MSNWTIDRTHSRVDFTVRHMMVSNVRGEFREFEADIEFDPERPTAASVTAKIAAASIDTGSEQRDGHLRSPDFLDAEQHPYLTFVSRSVEPVHGDSYRVRGDLTIRGVTRPVVLEAEITGVVRSLQGTGRVAGFSASTRISRKDWGLTWNVGLEAGGWLVGDEVRIALEVEAAEAVEAKRSSVAA